MLGKRTGEEYESDPKQLQDVPQELLYQWNGKERHVRYNLEKLYKLSKQPYLSISISYLLSGFSYFNIFFPILGTFPSLGCIFIHFAVWISLCISWTHLFLSFSPIISQIILICFCKSLLGGKGNGPEMPGKIWDWLIFPGKSSSCFNLVSMASWVVKWPWSFFMPGKTSRTQCCGRSCSVIEKRCLSVLSTAHNLLYPKFPHILPGDLGELRGKY